MSSPRVGGGISLWHQFRYLRNCRGGGGWGGGGAFAYETNLGFWETVLFPPRGLCVCVCGGGGAFAYETNLGFWETAHLPLP